MEGLQSDEGRAEDPFQPTTGGWNQLRPARSESLSVETKADVHFFIFNTAFLKANRAPVNLRVHKADDGGMYKNDSTNIFFAAKVVYSIT
jgi:hypothetical protein